MSKFITKDYLKANLKGYHQSIAEKEFVKQESGKSLVSETDIAKIGTNETNISNVKTLIGTIPTDATANTIVGYIDEAVENGAYDDTGVKGDIQTNKTAIDLLNDSEDVAGSVKNTVKSEINDFATKISDDGTVNTFKELIDYASSHTAEFSELSGTVQGNSTAIETLNGTGTTSVTGKISAAIGDLGNKSEGVAYASVKDYVDSKVADSILESETENIDFDTEW